MKLAIIGCNGQVGSEIVRAASAAELPAIGLRHSDCDVTNFPSIERALKPLSHNDVIINTAAFHRTDECEDAPDTALSVNTLGAYRLGAAAREHAVTCAYISTDFVFGGHKKTPYLESDIPDPINTYGVTKAAGESLVRIVQPASYIIRISAVFGPAGSSGKGGNFVESMVALARAGNAPEVVDDIAMAPTSAKDAATLLVGLLQRSAPFGIYHLANAGQCSWHEFASAIFEMVGAPVRPVPVSADSRPGKAKRPAYSVLASERLQQLGMHARPWRDALAEYLAEKGYLVRPA